MRPNEINEYIEAHKSERAAKDKKDKLRKSVLEHLKEYGDYEDINLGKQERVSIDETELHKWLEKTQPRDVMYYLTKVVLDLEKFENLVKREEIKIEDIPGECYSIKQIDVINILKRREV